VPIERRKLRSPRSAGARRGLAATLLRVTGAGRRAARTAAPLVVLATSTAVSAGAERPGVADETPARPAPIACGGTGAAAVGPPDRTLVARAASIGIRARWCERYDRWGRSTRVGPYREHYPSGAIRAIGRYVDGVLSGPIELRHENGEPFLRGTLSNGFGQDNHVSSFTTEDVISPGAPVPERIRRVWIVGGPTVFGSVDLPDAGWVRERIDTLGNGVDTFTVAGHVRRVAHGRKGGTSS
jgi:hypothetical protein